MRRGRTHRFCLHLSLLLLVWMLFAPSVQADAATSAEPFRVGMEVNYAPFNWSQTTAENGAVPVVNSPGEYANGYDVWMARRIADGLGRPLEIQKIEWDGLPPALTSGKIDAIIAGMSPTAERKEQIDFTEKYYTSDLVIVVKKEGPFASAQSLGDFSGAKVTGQLNTFHYTMIDQIPGVLKQEAMDSFPTMMTALDAGTIDGYISERPGAMAAIAANPRLAMVTFPEGQGFEADPEDTTVAVGLAKGSPLRESINQILSGIPEQERQQTMDQMVSIQLKSESEEGEDQPAEGFLASMMSIWNEYSSLFLRGIAMTLLISLLGTAFGLLIGFAVQIVRTIPVIRKRFRAIPVRLVQWILTAYVEIFRSTPMMVQAMLIYYGSKQFFNIDMNPLAAGILIVSINTGAYLAETVRGGIDSVDQGQFEAAHALGLSHGQKMRYIILPQAMRAILPSIGNELIVNIKDTSVLNVISVTELFFLTKSVAGSTLQIFPAYMIVALIYFVLTRLANAIIRVIGQRVNPGSRFEITSVTGTEV